MNKENDWEEYHHQTKGRPVSALLKEALTHVQHKNSALDLGAGALVETKFLLAEGFSSVTAIDTTHFMDIDDPRYKFVESSFEEYEFPKETFDLVNAQFALPFNKPATFKEVWKRMLGSLVREGVFSGQLFGLRDAWNTPSSSLSFHSRAQAEALLQGLEIIKFEEIEKEAPLASGGTKHWHIFAIIARK